MIFVFVCSLIIGLTRTNFIKSNHTDNSIGHTAEALVPCLEQMHQLQVLRLRGKLVYLFLFSKIFKSKSAGAIKSNLIPDNQIDEKLTKTLAIPLKDFHQLTVLDLSSEFI